MNAASGVGRVGRRADAVNLMEIDSNKTVSWRRIVVDARTHFFEKTRCHRRALIKDIQDE
jgi:hypothetical protein